MQVSTCALAACAAGPQLAPPLSGAWRAGTACTSSKRNACSLLLWRMGGRHGVHGQHVKCMQLAASHTLVHGELQADEPATGIHGSARFKNQGARLSCGGSMMPPGAAGLATPTLPAPPLQGFLGRQGRVCSQPCREVLPLRTTSAISKSQPPAPGFDPKSHSPQACGTLPTFEAACCLGTWGLAAGRECLGGHAWHPLPSPLAAHRRRAQEHLPLQNLVVATCLWVPRPCHRQAALRH